MKIFLKYIVMAACVAGCKDLPDKTYTDGTASPIPAIDTVKTRPAGIYSSPVIFEAAFIKGTKVEYLGSKFDLYGVNIGHLKIPSGRIVACDPLHTDEYGIPFTHAFPTGEFPVQLAVGRLGLEEMVAFARISFSNEPVVRWEMALQAGQAPLPLKSKKIHGYGVDGSVGLFLDSAALKELDQKSVSDFEGGAMYKKMVENYRNNWQYTMLDFGQHNLAAFSTGIGDGRYASYIGFDAGGKACRLITDFDLFKWK